jgi:hypothetical protein
MKISRILSVSVIAGAVLFSGTACSAGKTVGTPVSSPTSSTVVQSPSPSPEALSTESVKPSDSSTEKSSSVTDEQKAVSKTINDFYSYVSDPSNGGAITEAGAPLQGRGNSATAEELKQLVDTLPQGFKYFDTSTPDQIKNAYVQLITGSVVMGQGLMEANVPVSAVTVDGDTATVDSTAIEIKLNGENVPMNSSPSKTLKLKKNDSGSWVMIAEAITSGSGSVTGSGSATIEGSTTK